MNKDDLNKQKEELAKSREVLQAKRRRVQQLRENVSSDRTASIDQEDGNQSVSSKLKDQANNLRAASQFLSEQTADLGRSAGKRLSAREAKLKRDDALMSMHERIQDRIDELR